MARQHLDAEQTCAGAKVCVCRAHSGSPSTNEVASVTTRLASFARRRASRRDPGRLAFSYRFAATRWVTSQVRTKASEGDVD
jgi:hypothetical protein